MNNADDSYIGVLLEQIRDELRVVHEAVADVPKRGEFDELRHGVAEIKQDIHVLKAAVADVSQDVKVIKAAVSDHSHELASHERRILRLEAA